MTLVGVDFPPLAGVELQLQLRSGTSLPTIRDGQTFRLVCFVIRFIREINNMEYGQRHALILIENEYIYIKKEHFISKLWLFSQLHQRVLCPSGKNTN